jgi:hypothetical protein
VTVAAPAGYLPRLPDGFIEGLEDTGQWREAGITHWHLTSHEHGTSRPERYEGEAVRARAAGGEPERDPHRALAWVYTEFLTGLHRSPTPELFAAQRGWHDEAAFLGSVGNSWESMIVRAVLLIPVGGGLAVRGGLSLDVFAEPMTSRTCARH